MCESCMFLPKSELLKPLMSFMATLFDFVFLNDVIRSSSISST
jgi:hypothetical protein